MLAMKANKTAPLILTDGFMILNGIMLGNSCHFHPTIMAEKGLDFAWMVLCTFVDPKDKKYVFSSYFSLCNFLCNSHCYYALCFSVSFFCVHDLIFLCSHTEIQSATTLTLVELTRDRGICLQFIKQDGCLDVLYNLMNTFMENSDIVTRVCLLLDNGKNNLLRNI